MGTQTIPDDLVRTQVDALRTYEALARTANGRSRTALRRLLVQLTARVDAHPHWQGRTPPPGARFEVRRRARDRIAGARETART
ncbi:hypothetical protein ACOKM5_43020 [Streptomyces sp. BH097]|uniref:hypothetical protein n=1 Tax=unclassified Streptomyces TaxID=2593676 RepID=UPI003BB53EBB